MRCLSVLFALVLAVLTSLPEEATLEAAPPRRRPQVRRPQVRRPQARRPQARRPQARPQVRRPATPANRPNPNGQNNNANKPNPAAQTFEVEIPLHEDAKFRTLQLPVVFDEKGRVKTYTPEEQAALKGETPEERKLTGFKAGMNELKTGDVLQILLGTPKGNPSPGTKVALAPNGGELNGTLTRVTSKSLTVKVTGSNPPAGASGGQTGKGPAKFTLAPEKKQASLVVVKERAAAPQGKPKK